MDHIITDTVLDLQQNILHVSYAEDALAQPLEPGKLEHLAAIKSEFPVGYSSTFPSVPSPMSPITH